MPISQNTYTVPNSFVQQYDLGQKKIRADLVDENFTDAASAINTLLTDDANTVHLTGAETISGNKTFTGSNTFSGTTAFSGTTTAVTQSAGDNSTKLATTEYADAAAGAIVVPSASSSTPAARSTNGAVGTSSAYARADHSHPKNWASSTASATAPAVVVETWHSGTEWYRKWSDGWIEQGGHKIATSSSGTETVNLNISFSNTNYVALITNTGNVFYNTNANAGYFATAVKTTASFQVRITSSVAGLQEKDWYACGY